MLSVSFSHSSPSSCWGNFSIHPVPPGELFHILLTHLTMDFSLVLFHSVIAVYQAWPLNTGFLKTPICLKWTLLIHNTGNFIDYQKLSSPVHHALPKTHRIVPLAGLVHTLPMQAYPALATLCALSRWQLLGQTHHLALPDYSAPQTSTYIHAWAHCVLGPEG